MPRCNLIIYGSVVFLSGLIHHVIDFQLENIHTKPCLK